MTAPITVQRVLIVLALVCPSSRRSPQISEVGHLIYTAVCRDMIVKFHPAVFIISIAFQVLFFKRKRRLQTASLFFMAVTAGHMLYYWIRKKIKRSKRVS